MPYISDSNSSFKNALIFSHALFATFGILRGQGPATITLARLDLQLQAQLDKMISYYHLYSKKGTVPKVEFSDSLRVLKFAKAIFRFDNI